MTNDTSPIAQHVRVLPAREPPVEQRALLEAHDRFLRDAHALFASMHAKFDRLSVYVTHALFARLITQARAMQALIRLGYTSEAESLARAVANTAVTIVAIVHEDPDSHALQYLAHSQRLRRAELKAYRERDIVSVEDAERFDTEVREREERTMAEYAEGGVVPKPLSDESEFWWHGYRSEKALYDAMNASFWYDVYYRPFSDEVHASSRTIAAGLRLLGAERRVGVGPTFEDPWRLVMASADCVVQALEQLHDLSGIERGPEFESLKRGMEAAVSEHGRRLSAALRLQVNEPASGA